MISVMAVVSSGACVHVCVNGGCRSWLNGAVDVLRRGLQESSGARVPRHEDGFVSGEVGARLSSTRSVQSGRTPLGCCLMRECQEDEMLLFVHPAH